MRLVDFPKRKNERLLSSVTTLSWALLLASQKEELEWQNMVLESYDVLSKGML